MFDCVWSSVVCSSDLSTSTPRARRRARGGSSTSWTPSASRRGGAGATRRPTTSSRRTTTRARSERALERGPHVRAPLRHRGRGARPGALRVGGARGRRGDTRDQRAPAALRRAPRARALRPRPRARGPRARRPEPARDPDAAGRGLALGAVGAGAPVSGEDRVLAGLRDDGAGRLARGASRYLLVRPEREEERRG